MVAIVCKITILSIMFDIALYLKASKQVPISAFLRSILVKNKKIFFFLQEWMNKVHNATRSGHANIESADLDKI